MGGAAFPPLLLDLNPKDGGGKEDNVYLLQKVPCTHCYTQGLLPWSRAPWLMPPPETPGHTRACLGQFPIGSLLLSSGSWCTQGLVCALQESVFPVLCKFWWFYSGVNGNLLQGGLCHTQVCCTQSPCSRPLLTHTSTGETQTQFWLSLCGLGMRFCVCSFPRQTI